ncbi:MAG TPA: tetratricopeptide repeat protein [bacterium]
MSSFHNQKGIAFTLPVFLFLGIAVQTSRAEQIMDSVDALSAAQQSSYGRANLGYFADAFTSGQKALQMAENRYGPTHPSVVPYLNGLGTIDRCMARYADAESKFKWGLAIREKTLGPNDPRIAESLDQLAALYQDWGKFDEAKFNEKKALAILEPMGKPSEALCQTLNHLGDIQLGLREASEAQTALKRSHELEEKDPKISVSLRIETLGLLARASMADQQLKEAETCLKRGLELAKQNFKEENVELGDAHRILADFYQSQGESAKAQPLYQSALKIYQHFVGINYTYQAFPYLARAAAAYQATGDFASSKNLGEKIVTGIKDVYGPTHPGTAVALLNLAKAEESLNEKPKALSHIKESLKILQSNYEKDHPLVKAAEKRLKELSGN